MPRRMKHLWLCLAIIRIYFYCAIVFFKKETIFLCSKQEIMLQRIQTIYLLIALVSAGVLPFIFPLWTTASGNGFMFMENLGYIVLFGLSATLSLVSIVSFKKRKSQFVMGRLNIILNLILLGLFIFRSLNLSGETDKDLVISEKGIGMLLPIVSIVFLSLANKAIKKDEDLVKSVDRLR